MGRARGGLAPAPEKGPCAELPASNACIETDGPNMARPPSSSLVPSCPSAERKPWAGVDLWRWPSVPECARVKLVCGGAYRALHLQDSGETRGVDLGATRAGCPDVEAPSLGSLLGTCRRPIASASPLWTEHLIHATTWDKAWYAGEVGKITCRINVLQPQGGC